MVVKESPNWLPSGFTEKVKYKNGRRIKYFYNDATGTKYYSKKDVLSCAASENGRVGTPQSLTSNGNDKGISPNGKAEVGLDTTYDSPNWLPAGWTVEERTRKMGSRKGSVYKVYTDVSTGNRFYSKPAVARFLNSPDHAVAMTIETETNKVDESSTNALPITNTDGGQEEKKDKASKTLDKVDESSPLMSPQTLSTTSTDYTLRKKKKGSSFIPVATESSAADDLPPGWIKEIVTSKSGSKTRKDAYYIDPVSGYTFRSKPDAMRYIMTNDIRQCAIRPRKRESSELNLNLNLNLNLVNNEARVATESSAVDDLPPGWVKEIVTSKSGRKARKDVYYIDPISGYAFRSKPDALRYLRTNDTRKCAIRPKKRELSELNLVKNEVQSSNPANEKLPEQLPRPVTGGELNGYGERSGVKTPADSDNKLPHENTNKPEQQQLPESRTEKQSEKKPRPNSKTPRKTKDRSLPSRASKRLAGSEPEMPPDSVVSKRSRSAAARRSSATGEANVAQKSPSDVPTSSETPKETQPSNGTENPPTEAPIIPEEQMEAKTDENNKRDSQLYFDFGESWSDPLEFALKTLRGDISIDETLAAFPGCFNENLSAPYNNNNNNNNNQLDGILGSTLSQSGMPDIFQNDKVASIGGSSRKEGGVDPLRADSCNFENIDFPPGFGSFSGEPK